MNELLYLPRIGLSILLGLLIGWEREKYNKPAGVRDVALVSLGAALFSIISLELANIAAVYPLVSYDIGRIPAYTIASIGFLGSGVIILYKGNLEGVTTAAILWVMVATGMLCGLGSYFLAIISAICIYFVMQIKRFVKLEGGDK